MVLLSPLYLQYRLWIIPRPKPQLCHAKALHFLKLTPRETIWTLQSLQCWNFTSKRRRFDFTKAWMMSEKQNTSTCSKRGPPKVHGYRPSACRGSSHSIDGHWWLTLRYTQNCMPTSCIIWIEYIDIFNFGHARHHWSLGATVTVAVCGSWIPVAWKSFDPHLSLQVSRLYHIDWTYYLCLPVPRSQAYTLQCLEPGQPPSIIRPLFRKLC